jgi:hypothetical protein
METMLNFLDSQPSSNGIMRLRVETIKKELGKVEKEYGDYKTTSMDCIQVCESSTFHVFQQIGRLQDYLLPMAIVQAPGAIPQARYTVQWDDRLSTVS